MAIGINPLRGALAALVIGVGLSAIAPVASANSAGQTVAQATPTDSARVEVINHTIPFSQNQTLDALMGQASATAQGLINRGFAANPAATAVQVTILNSRNGNIVPLMMVRVGRAEWQSNPRVEQWSQYLGTIAMQLLDPVAPDTTFRVVPGSATTRSTATTRRSSPTTQRTRATPGRSRPASSASTPANPVSTPANTSRRPFVPISTGGQENFVLPGMSLEESDPGYR